MAVNEEKGVEIFSKGLLLGDKIKDKKRDGENVNLIVVFEVNRSKKIF